MKKNVIKIVMGWCLVALMDQAIEASLPAGNDTGNGGYGIRIGDKIYSFDLAIAGIHLSPYAPLSGTESLLPSEKKLIESKLADIKDKEVLAIVETKLASLRQQLKKENIFYPLNHVIYNMTRFSFSYHKDLECTKVNDNSLPYANWTKVQLAYRKGDQIKFCKDFSRIDRANQASNILHEIFYAAHFDPQAQITTNLIGLLFHHKYEQLDQYALVDLKRHLGSLTRANRDFNNTLTHVTNTFLGPWYFVEVQEIGSLSPSLISELQIPAGLSPCFGWFEYLAGYSSFSFHTDDNNEILKHHESLGAWFVFEGARCDGTFLEPVILFELEKAPAQPLILTGYVKLPADGPSSKGPVGMLKESTSLQLDILCSGPLKNGCRLNWDYGTFNFEASSFFNIVETLPIHSSLISQLEPPDGYKPCFGMARTCDQDSDEEYALWFVKNKDYCQQGYFYSRYGFRFRPSFKDRGIILGDTFAIQHEEAKEFHVPIGYVNLDPSKGSKELWYLCNGHYTGLCKITHGKKLEIFNEDETIFSATRHGHVERVSYLVGNDPSLINATDPQMYDRWPILTMAAVRKDDYGPKVVDWILKHGADVNLRSRSNHTPLYFCEEYHGHTLSCALIRNAGGTSP
ncbi:MAG: hypothetical protein HY537_17720 [Deltaproteobacteria bacterium]|nr:hypothetical protein [Deltaproteobacteria bacterium]